MFKSIHTPGTMIRTIHGFYSHHAIVSDRWCAGKPMLISLSSKTGTVTEESWQDCIGNRDVSLAREQGRISSNQVLANARSAIGKLRYNLFTGNCEHFARWTHGLKVESRQIKGALWTFAGLAAIYLLHKTSR